MHDAKRIEGDLPLAAVGELFKLHEGGSSDMDELRKEYSQEMDLLIKRRNAKVFEQMCTLMKAMGIEPSKIEDTKWYVDFSHFAETGVAFLCHVDERPAQSIASQFGLPGEKPLTDEPAPDGEQLN